MADYYFQNLRREISERFRGGVAPLPCTLPLPPVLPPALLLRAMVLCSTQVMEQIKRRQCCAPLDAPDYRELHRAPAATRAARSRRALLAAGDELPRRVTLPS